MDANEVQETRKFNEEIYGGRFALTMALGDAYNSMLAANLREDHEAYDEASELFDKLYSELEQRYPEHARKPVPLDLDVGRLRPLLEE